ncbi:Tc toxin subunit A [Yersinia sp. LJYL362]|uniref:Tc toxin subunit A n=1 Tax=Yersinia sp. LJYL362 TaxID=3402108 RepID=UPI003AB2ECA2
MSDKTNKTTSVNVSNNRAEQRAQQLRNDPVVNRISKLGVNGIPERSDKYVAPSSIQSMFSPGRYLCELYQVAQELHSKDSPLHIDKRRQDLKDLVLSETMMKQEVSTLDILLETLKKGVEFSDLSAPTVKSVDGSFILPYDDNLTIINAVLENKAICWRDIAALLADNSDIREVKLTPILVQEQLGLNPASYELIKTELAKSDGEHKRLAHAAKLSVKQLVALVTSIKNGGVNEEEVLAVISEYVRLNRQYGLSVDQFIAIFGKIKTKEASDDIKNNRITMISHLFGMNASQMKMLFTLCGKPEALQGAAEGNAPHVLTIFSMFENIVQWMSEQKLDLAALNAMLTNKYSATATPELFNFLSNIYHSVDNQADATLLEQSLCRSLAAGFHLKTNVISGVLRWLEANNSEFKLEKFWQAITETFTDRATLKKLENHPLLVIQCQKLSQYILIVQWAELTEQDIDILLEAKLFNDSNDKLAPSLLLLSMLVKFKAWQQQVKVPVSEALTYFTHINILQSDEKTETEELHLAQIDADKADDNLQQSVSKLARIVKDHYNYYISIQDENGTLSPEEQAEIVNKLEGYKSAENKESAEKQKLSIISSQAYVKVQNLINRNEDNKISRKKEWEEIHKLLAQIHGWDIKQTETIINQIADNKYPKNFESLLKITNAMSCITDLNVDADMIKPINSLIFTTKNTELFGLIPVISAALHPAV